MHTVNASDLHTYLQLLRSAREDEPVLSATFVTGDVCLLRDDPPNRANLPKLAPTYPSTEGTQLTGRTILRGYVRQKGNRPTEQQDF